MPKKKKMLQGIPDVQRMADDPLVARWMTHRFPHLYQRPERCLV